MPELATHLFMLIINKFNLDTGIWLAWYIFKRIKFDRSRYKVNTEKFFHVNVSLQIHQFFKLLWCLEVFQFTDLLLSWQLLHKTKKNLKYNLNWWLVKFCYKFYILLEAKESLSITRELSSHVAAETKKTDPSGKVMQWKCYYFSIHLSVYLALLQIKKIKIKKI